MLEALEERYAPAVLSVTTNADSGPGSLRVVVNTASSGDTIHFAIQNQTISLTTGQISLNASLTIDGQNNNITISSSGTSRVFYNAVASLSEEIDNLTFLFNRATNNGAPDFGRGGAVYDLGNLTLNSDTFTESMADGSGGAVYTGGGTLTVNNSHFTSNQSSHSGGAIDVDLVGTPGDVVLNNTSFTGNGASGPGGAVSAIGRVATKLTVTACDFSTDSASNGGAIFTSDQLTVSAGSFTGDQASSSGGAISYAFTATAATDSSSMSLQNITFTNNTAGGNGGAVASSITASQGTAAVTVTGCLFTGNQATNSGEKGGGLYVNHATSGTGSASLSVTNSTFYNGDSDMGGGIALDNSTSNAALNTVALTSLTVYDNQAATAGAGLWISAATGVPGLRPQLHNSIFAGNTVVYNPTNGPDVFGNALSLGFNLIGKTDGSGNTVWLSSDWKGTSAQPLDPGLDPNGPTDNGGKTFTIKLVSGSVAYHHGDPLLGSGPGGLHTTDQRGYYRQAMVSIGAYDPDATAPPP